MVKDFLLWQIIFKNKQRERRGKQKNTKWEITLIGKRYICNKMKKKQKSTKKYVKHTLIQIYQGFDLLIWVVLFFVTLSHVSLKRRK